MKRGSNWHPPRKNLPSKSPALLRLRNTINVKLENDYLKCVSNLSFVPHKILDNILVAIRKNESYVNT